MSPRSASALEKALLHQGHLEPGGREAWPVDSGVDGIILGSHGGRQMDWAISALDILPQARAHRRRRISPLYMSGGIRHGTDMLKALRPGRRCGADRPRHPVRAMRLRARTGWPGPSQLLHDRDALNELGQMGVASLDKLSMDALVREGDVPLRAVVCSRLQAAFLARGPGHGRHEGDLRGRAAVQPRVLNDDGHIGSR